MMGGILARLCRAGILGSFILFVYFTLTSSAMTLDLTEFKNKASRIKVNPRGNLWATGHFMGKRRVVDNSFLEPAYGDLGIPGQAKPGSPAHRSKDVTELIIRMMTNALQAQQAQQKPKSDKGRDPA